MLHTHTYAVRLPTDVFVCLSFSPKLIAYKKHATVVNSATAVATSDDCPR